MDETKVKGLKIYMDNRFIQIMDSYQIINKNKMEIIIDEIMNKYNITNSIWNYCLLCISLLLDSLFDIS